MSDTQRHKKPGVRIIAGSLKGKTLTVPEGYSVRPMRTRIRGALFNMLHQELPGSRFLDIFSGSGSIGIEALSRGVHSAVFVEHDPPVLRLLERALAQFSLNRRGEIQDVDIYDSLPTTREPFRHVFLDPPFPDYHDPQRDPWTIATRLWEAKMLTDNAVVGFEYPSKLPPPQTLPGFEEDRRKRYGDSSLILWRVRQ